MKLKDICIKITDGSHYSPVGKENGYPMFSVQDMDAYGFDYTKCKYISEKDYRQLVKNGCRPEVNDVLVAKDGSYLKEIFVVEQTKDEVVLSSIAILKPNTNIANPYYLAYLLSSNGIKKVVANKYVSGTALKRIILDDFAKIDIDMQSKDTQDKIVSIIKPIDDQIQRNNEMVKKLQSFATTISCFSNKGEIRYVA